MVITIIGTGLIGGSMAINLKERGFAQKVIGVDRCEENLDKALRRRIIDEGLPLEEAVAKSELIIIAIPVDAIVALLPKLMDLIEDQIVLEVGSTKEKILQQVANHPKRAQLVASHPMAGTEFSGPEAAVPNLFDHKYSVICEVEKTNSYALQIAKQVYQTLKMKLIYLSPIAHDIHTAYVSHIAHLSSFALALTVLKKETEEDRIFELASGGFASSVRLAKSSAAMWVPIFRQNKENVLDVLEEHIDNLNRFKKLLLDNDFDTISELIQSSNKIKKILK